jgi:hypothetical protein
VTSVQAISGTFNSATQLRCAPVTSENIAKTQRALNELIASIPDDTTHKPAVIEFLSLFNARCESLTARGYVCTTKQWYYLFFSIFPQYRKDFEAFTGETRCLAMKEGIKQYLRYEKATQSSTYDITNPVSNHLTIEQQRVFALKNQPNLKNNAKFKGPVLKPTVVLTDSDDDQEEHKQPDMKTSGSDSSDSEEAETPVSKKAKTTPPSKASSRSPSTTRTRASSLSRSPAQASPKSTPKSTPKSKKKAHKTTPKKKSSKKQDTKKVSPKSNKRRGSDT